MNISCKHRAFWLVSTLTAEEAFEYASYVLSDRFPACEPVIATHAGCAYYYASCVLNSRFILGEPTIAENAHFAYLYAVYVLSARFTAGEPAIMRDRAHRKRYQEAFKINENNC